MGTTRLAPPLLWPGDLPPTHQYRDLTNKNARRATVVCVCVYKCVCATPLYLFTKEAEAKRPMTVCVCVCVGLQTHAQVLGIFFSLFSRWLYHQ
jgi:hypothetical protein